MSAVNDGGPAFPAPDAGEEHFSQRSAYMGMSLRDYFAGNFAPTMIRMVADGIHSPDAGMTPAEAASKAAYSLADAMLRAREVKP